MYNLIRSLEEGIQLNHRIINDPNTSVKDKQNSIEQIILYSAHLYKLALNGHIRDCRSKNPGLNILGYRIA